MPSDLENRDEKAGLDFIFPISPGSTSVSRKARARPAAIQPTAALNPNSVSRTPPRKKPTPFSAFFDPVRIATHLNSCF